MGDVIELKRKTGPEELYDRVTDVLDGENRVVVWDLLSAILFEMADDNDFSVAEFSGSFALDYEKFRQMAADMRNG